MMNWGTHMIPHSEDLNIVPTTGAFNSGQEAHIHRHFLFQTQMVMGIAGQPQLHPMELLEKL